MTDRAEPAGTIGLALSGGGARCFAQIGVLKAIEEAGLRVSAIAANSSAAILGAIYAARPDSEYLEAAMRAIDFSSFMNRGGSSGLLGHQGIEELLAEHAPATFEELAIPLAVPAVDIERAQMLVFNQGPLVPPVCASNAFPGLFVPVNFHGRNLMDGGIINNFPVDIIRTLTSRPVLAIDCRSTPTASLNLDDPAGNTLVDKIGALFSNGLPTVVKVLIQAYTITQDRVVEITCAMHPPDLRLTPALPDDFDIQDFSRLDEAIEIGYQCATEAVAAGQFEAFNTVD